MICVIHINKDKEMKPTMLYTLLMITAIVLMVVFDISIGPNETIAISPIASPNTLYVCPAASEIWDQIAQGFSLFKKPLIIIFFFMVIVALFFWGWALYQNLLKDKFVRDEFKKPWGFTRILLMATVMILLMMKTPNYFRSVSVDGLNGQWVLCDNNTPNARAVPENAVHR